MPGVSSDLNRGGEPARVPGAGEVREQLAAVVRSRQFAEADRLKELLEYLVTAALDGKHVKEWDIGTSVFGLKNDFEPRTESPVRSTVWRLRKKLGEYYEAEGRNDAIVITLPKGGYAPEFAYRQTIALPEAVQRGGLRRWSRWRTGVAAGVTSAGLGFALLLAAPWLTPKQP